MIPGGRICDIPVSNLDLFPTLLEAARIKVPAGKILDGQSIMGLFKGSDDFPVRPFYWHFPVYLENGNAETADPLFRTRPGSAIRWGEWKLIRYFEEGTEELYHLTEDISEKENLIGTQVEKARELSEMLSEWQSELNAPIPDIPNPEYIPGELK